MNMWILLVTALATTDYEDFTNYAEVSVVMWDDDAHTVADKFTITTNSCNYYKDRDLFGSDQDF